ncbi:MAG: hypothetical protein ACXQT2_04185 [Methanotrichaceae archaeon]
MAIGLVKDELKRRSGAGAELLQTIEALDDLDEVINRLDERLYEWSRLYREDVVQVMGAEKALFMHLKGRHP